VSGESALACKNGHKEKGGMKSGIISLSSLYKIAKEDNYGLSLKGNSPEGRLLGGETRKLCKDIDDSRGFYIWGNYQKSNSLWRTVYLGKAMKGKTASLRARITEELIDERFFLWSENKDDFIKIYNIFKKLYKRDYEKECKRAFRKRETTHIIWVGTPNIDNKKLLTVEADLIETLNPIVNIHRPKPTSELLDQTVKIIKLMKHQIHENRPQKSKGILARTE
jgi:hypothetical protein